MVLNFLTSVIGNFNSIFLLLTGKDPVQSVEAGYVSVDLHRSPSLYNGRSVRGNKASLCTTRVSGISASPTGECSGGDNPTNTLLQRKNNAATISLNGHTVLNIASISSHWKHVILLYVNEHKWITHSRHCLYKPSPNSTLSKLEIIWSLTASH